MNLYFALWEVFSNPLEMKKEEKIINVLILSPGKVDIFPLLLVTLIFNFTLSKEGWAVSCLTGKVTGILIFY